MANSSLTLSSIDFDTLKQNYKNFLKTQSVFKDYNFEGSNINVLLDVMSYNSYLNSFYLNMVASEMFLDSAQKYDTVVSHAKELNYLPRSYSSSVANVNFTAETTGINLPFTVPRGTTFTGTNSNGSYTFTTTETQTYTSTNSQYSVENLRVYEGTFVNNSFIMDYTDETQKFVLTNSNLDFNTLKITIYEDNKQKQTDFTRVDTLFGLTRTSNVYFLQAAQNGQYEILFGDGILGRRPKNEALIVAEYLVSSGSNADGVYLMNINNDLSLFNGGRISVTSVTVTSNSAGGANSEGIESIRFYAPRYFATQQRAVASDDYSSIILSKFGGVISDVNVFGGELLEPKQYGRVVLCLKPSSSTIAPDYIKTQISNYMLDYISLPTRMIISDPDYFYCHIHSTIQFNKNATTKLANEIKNNIFNTIKTFSANNLEKFESDFRYSKFVCEIDDTDPSITSNNTEVQMIKKLYPKPNFLNSYIINFDNKTQYNSLHNDPVVTSSLFTYISDSGIYYPLSYIKDDNNGKLIVYTFINDIYTILNDNIGSVDYETGKVIISKLNVSDYGTSLNIYMNPSDKDIIINKSKILMVDLNDVNINIIETIR